MGRREPLETSILNEFLVLEETNSFSNAARQLQISQATLSRHIKQLEDLYGVCLFERTTQRVRLTSYGEALVPYARSILQSERSFKWDVERIRFQRTNHLVIGTVDFPFYYGITTQLAAFKTEHPGATLEVQLAATDELLEMLDTGKVDVAFIRDIEHVADRYQSFLYAEDPLMIAIPADHPLADQESASIQQFAGDTFYHRYRKGSLMDHMVTALFREAGIHPQLSVATGSREDSVINAPNTVTTCLGGLAENFRGNVHVKVLTLEPKCYANIYLAAPKDAPLSDLAAAFMDFVQARVEE